jgi:hypothetical protein
MAKLISMLKLFPRTELFDSLSGADLIEVSKYLENFICKLTNVFDQGKKAGLLSDRLERNSSLKLADLVLFVQDPVQLFMNHSDYRFTYTTILQKLLLAAQDCLCFVPHFSMLICYTLKGKTQKEIDKEHIDRFLQGYIQLLYQFNGLVYRDLIATFSSAYLKNLKRKKHVNELDFDFLDLVKYSYFSEFKHVIFDEA